MKKNNQKNIGFIFVVLLIILSLFGTGFLYFKEKYKGSAIAYSHSLIKQMDEQSLEYKIVKLFYSQEQLQQMKQEDQETSVQGGYAPETLHVDSIYGPTYQGYMLVVPDPTMVKVAVNPNLDNGQQAPSLMDYVKDNQAIAGINAGGFEDAGGTGNGGLAWGIVIQDGKLVSGGMDEYYPIIGIDGNNRLICTDTTARQALDWGMKEAVTFGPVFLNNYKVVFKNGDGQHPMLNPRTAIGQREDGTFLMLVIDGRGPSSFGALYSDVIKIFQSYNAINAANLDGGNSTAMIYEGEYVNTPTSMYGSRHLPTAFIVKGE